MLPKVIKHNGAHELFMNTYVVVGSTVLLYRLSGYELSDIQIDIIAWGRVSCSWLIFEFEIQLGEIKKSIPGYLSSLKYQIMHNVLSRQNANNYTILYTVYHSRSICWYTTQSGPHHVLYVATQSILVSMLLVQAGRNTAQKINVSLK